jgi:hypothetical protein
MCFFVEKKSFLKKSVCSDECETVVEDEMKSEKVWWPGQVCIRLVFEGKRKKKRKNTVQLLLKGLA